ncbi:26S proteasome regulatory subunit [Micractinium conductrix]|uniref:26S proteasome regulatory subunit n=1 Tax=Micractinium conductrix TaxID=554055 RepID=A0A2P6VBU2_9CHLO|nr:26S proteasome regulatory subunit [Micractinium conductrix]|eukprot:PSC71553.1 26S proteasome regulatory subunit [Micractinium conductrix]
MGKDVAMAEAEAPNPDKGDQEKTTPEPQRPLVVLRGGLAVIKKAVEQKETRTLFGRLLRQTAGVRRRLTAADLTAFLNGALPQGSPVVQQLVDAVQQAGESAMEADGAANGTDGGAAAAPPAEEVAAPSGLPEVEAYCHLVTLMFLVDHKQWAAAQAVAGAAVERLSAHNRRTLDVLAARIYAYLSLAHERSGSLAAIRSSLLGLHRTAVLRHDDVGAETLLNLLLRNYLHYNLYDQAERLRAKAHRPEASRSMQQACRYLYYLGRIRAVQLEYSEAKDCLQQAARKAPSSAVGFRVAVAKWLVLVRLLLGEVPDRTELTAPDMAAQLAPYFAVAAAVRSGDLNAFSNVAATHAAVFRADRTQNLIVRLRHNVIRAGLRRISLAYSRISLADVAQRLGLASVQDTESIVAKAIRDGSIEGSINHEAGTLESARPVDVYATEEPASAFHARIAFCMDVHNEAIKAMRYGEGGGAVQEFEDATALRERQEQELQAALEEDEDF